MLGELHRGLLENDDDIPDGIIHRRVATRRSVDCDEEAAMGVGV
jgi:hypothetical protein